VIAPQGITAAGNRAFFMVCEKTAKQGSTSLSPGPASTDSSSRAPAGSATTPRCQAGCWAGTSPRTSPPPPTARR
jgi:hypothetical protein